jgi:bifunctional non-homologous end joining protein LigD
MARTAKLATYRAKRDFAITDEPSGDAAARPSVGRGYVIQKHAASRLHYDFRLELDGVLLSWSVPKGPSLSPSTRRLAVRTEDHPLDYAGFEGIIPAGQYGGGTVVVWDRGTWESEGDAQTAMAKGRLTFTLHGEKLHGRWHLVRTKPQGKQEGWLLFKGRDAAADDTADIVVEQPASVISGRTIDEVAAQRDRVWHSNRAERAADTAAILAQLPLGFPLTSLGKSLYPEQGLTKAQLLGYLAVAAERMLPHVAGRPLTLVRCPRGQGKPCFFQKHLGAGTPPPVAKLPIAGEDDPYMVIHDMPGLVALAQMGSLEIHTWGSHAPDIEHPDVIVFDLDPDVGLAWDRVALAAFEIRKRLSALGLESFVKTTGGKGLHVCVPLTPTAAGDWDAIKAWTKTFAEQLEADDPRAYTSNMAKSARKDRIFVDYLRNGRNATFIAPYSPRARTGAPVALPITWDDLAAGVDPASFTITSVPARLADAVDPWRDYAAAAKQALPRRPAARRRSKRP